MEQGCWRRGGGGQGVPLRAGSPPPAWAGLVAAARMDGGPGMPVAGRGGRRCPTSPRRVTAPALGPAVRPQGRNGVSPFSSCDAVSTAGPILPERLPAGQGHLRATLHERDPVPTAPHCPGLRPLSALRGVPASPPRDIPRPSAHLKEPQRAASTIPSPDATSRGSPHLPPPQGCSRRSPLPVGERALALGGRGVRLRGGAYPAQTRSPARPGCREKWRDRGSSCRAQEGPDSARGGGRREEGESVALAWPTPPAAPTPARIPHPRRASPIPKRGAGVAQHRCLPGPREQRGWRNQAIFPLNLISSFPPTPPQLEAGWLRRSKSGREKRDDGSKRQGGRPHVPAPRPGLFGTDRKN